MWVLTCSVVTQNSIYLSYLRAHRGRHSILRAFGGKALDFTYLFIYSFNIGEAGGLAVCWVLPGPSGIQWVTCSPCSYRTFTVWKDIETEPTFSMADTTAQKGASWRFKTGDVCQERTQGSGRKEVWVERTKDQRDWWARR